MRERSLGKAASSSVVPNQRQSITQSMVGAGELASLWTARKTLKAGRMNIRSSMK
jgi:hypothetical protein